MLLGTDFVGLPALRGLTTPLSTTPSEGVGTVNFAVALPTFRT